MNKLDYGNFDSTNADIAFSETNGYSNPTSELLTRKQFSYPLKEIKTFLGNAIPVDSNGNVVQLEVNDDNSLSYRSTPGGALTDLTGGIPSGGTTGQFLKKSSGTDYDTAWASIPQILSGTTEPSADLGNDGDIYVLYEE